AALARDAKLAGVRTQRGDLLRDAKADVYLFSLRLHTPPDVRILDPRGPAPVSVPSMVNAIQSVGAGVRSVGAVHVEAGRQSQAVQIEVRDPESIPRILKAVADLPGASVTALQWSAGSSPAGMTILTIQVTSPTPR